MDRSHCDHSSSSSKLMYMLPKSSAEILAAAKWAPQKRTHKAKINRSIPFSHCLSTISVTPSPDNATASGSKISTALFQSERFQTTLEIREDRDVGERTEQDSVLVTGASANEPEAESPVDDLAHSQMGKSLSARISDALATLRDCGLSPFDLVLEILDEDKTQYAYHRRELYKEGNQTLLKIFDAILASDPGRRKLQTWILRPTAVDLACEPIAEEMTCVQKADLTTSGGSRHPLVGGQGPSHYLPSTLDVPLRIQHQKADLTTPGDSRQHPLVGGQGPSHYLPSTSDVPRLPPILQVEKQTITTPATQIASPSRRCNEAHFVCPVPGCGRTFIRRFNLRGHLRFHTEERPYVCDWPGCKKSFLRERSHKRHQALHAARSLPANICQGCKKGFSGLDALNKHLRSGRGAECRQHNPTFAASMAGPQIPALQHPPPQSLPSVTPH